MLVNNTETKLLGYILNEVLYSSSNDTFKFENNELIHNWSMNDKTTQAVTCVNSVLKKALA